MLNRKGQNIAEYSILIALVIAAAVAMQTYVKRGIQGRVADATDFRADASGADAAHSANSFNTKQYEPYYIDTDAKVESGRYYKEGVSANADVTRNEISEKTTRKKDSYENTTWNDAVMR